MKNIDRPFDIASNRLLALFLKQAEKLKSREIKDGGKDSGWRVGDEGGCEGGGKGGDDDGG